MDLKSTYLVLFNLNEVNICDQLTNLTWLFISTVACSLLVDQALAIFVDLLTWGTYFPAFSRSFPSVPSQCLFCYIVIFPEYMAYPGPISFTIVVWWRASWVTPTVLRLRLYLAPVFQEHLYLAFVLWRAGFFFNHTRGWIWHLYEIFQVLWWMSFLLISRSSWVGWPMSRFHDSDFDVFIEFFRDVDYAVQVCILWLCFVFCRVSQLNILLLCGVNCHYLWDITDDDETSFCGVCL